MLLGRDLIQGITEHGSDRFMLPDRDGSRLLEAVYGQDAPRWLGDMPSVEILRWAWLAQYYLDEDRVRWRTAGDLPPARRRID